jgi:MHS family proline/betaine transporter-like MFS transporter
MPLRGSPPAVASEAEARALLRSDAPMTVDSAQPTLPEAAVPDEARPA